MEIFLPTFHHWSFGNNWSGSCGKVRFFVTTSKEDMLAQVWDQDVCHELAEIKAEARFEVTQEGLDAMRGWLLEQIAALSRDFS